MKRPNHFSETNIPSDWLVGKGVMPDLIRATDWSATPLGPRSEWPYPLQAITNIILSSRFAMEILWGEELIAIYNDAYGLIAADTHPFVLGKSTHEHWPEVAESARPILEKVMRNGESVFLEDHLFRIKRGAEMEDAYFTISYSPIWLEHGHVGGTLVTLIETTQRKTAEDKLLRSEHKYRTLFENLMQEVHLWKLVRDEHGNIKTWRLVDINPAGLKSWNKTRTETIGKTADEIFPHSNAVDHFMPVVQKIFSEGRPYTWESYFEGTGQVLYMTSVPFGEYFVSTGTDITVSKAHEHQLKERLKELNLIFFLSDLMNKPGIGLDELLGHTVQMIPSAWQFPEITEACIELEGKVFQTKNYKKTPWMQTSPILLHGETAGEITVCYSEEKTGSDEGPFLKEERLLLNTIATRLSHFIEKLRIEERIKLNETFLHTVIDSITGPFAVINVADHTIEMANAALGGEKAKGAKCYTLYHHRHTPCTLDDYLCPLLEVKATGKPYAGQRIFYDKYGQTFYREANAYPVFDQHQNIVQVIAHHTDITDRIWAEKELRQKAVQLQEMNTALKVLLERIEQDRVDMEEKIYTNYQLTLRPVIENLKKILTDKTQEDMIHLLESSLRGILSPVSKKLSDHLMGLTPKEILVADLIKQGKSNKEISEILGCSFHTVSRHRDNIRDKMALKNKKINLRTFLSSLE